MPALPLRKASILLHVLILVSLNCDTLALVTSIRFGPLGASPFRTRMGLRSGTANHPALPLAAQRADHLTAEGRSHFFAIQFPVRLTVVLVYRAQNL